MSESRLPTLTKEQEQKLEKLEKEIAAKKLKEEKNKAKNIAYSKRTGIPYNLVDTDVVKLGLILGILKLDGGDKSSKDGEGGLLDIFFNDFKKISEPPKYNLLPTHYVLSPSSHRISEDEKQREHIVFVEQECEKFTSFIHRLINTRYKKIDSVISLTKTPTTLENFIELVTESMNSVLDCIELDFSGGGDDDDIKEDDTTTTQQYIDELLCQLKILRSSLLGPLSICEYKNLLMKQIIDMSTKFSETCILSNLSYIEANLCMYGNNFKSIEYNENEVKSTIINEIIIRSYNKDPKLVSFDMSSILAECCVPAYMFLDSPIEILSNGIIGPYRHNCIGYLSNALPYVNTSFYIIKTITDDGIRMWVLDELLTTFSEKLRTACLEYCISLFRIYSKELTGSNYFTSHHMSRVQENLLKSIYFMCRPMMFRDFICSVISRRSPIVCTEFDVFNEIPTTNNNIALANVIRYPPKLFDDSPNAEFVQKYFNQKI